MLYVSYPNGYKPNTMPSVVEVEPGEKNFEIKFYVPGVERERISVKTKDRTLIVEIDNDEKYCFDIDAWNDQSHEKGGRLIKQNPESVSLNLGILTVVFDYNIPEDEYEQTYEIK